MNTRIVLLILALAVFGLPELKAQLADEAGTTRLAHIYETSGKFEDALRYYQDLLKNRPQNKNYFEGAYRCMMKLKQYDETIQLVTERIATFQNDPKLYVQRGSAYFSAGNEDAAFADWETAVERSPNTAIYTSISDEAVNLRLYDKAVEFLRRGEEAAKQPHVYAFKIARAYAMNNKFREAMREYILYLVVQPSSLWQIQQYIAQYSKLPEALGNARDEGRKAAAEYSDNPHVQYLYAWLCMEAKDYESALGVYKRVDELRNSGGRELLGFGHRAFNEGAFETAKNTFKLLTDNYKHAQFATEAQFYYARSIEALNDPQNAIVEDPTASFLESLKSQPKTESIPEYLGVIKLYEKLRAANGTHPVAIEAGYRIGYIKYHSFQDKDGALDVLEDVVKYYREVIGSMAVDMLIGEIHIASGDLEKAMETFKFIQSYPATTEDTRNEALFNIAEVHYFQGLFEDAMTELEPLTTNSNRDIANDALDLRLFIQPNMSPTEVPLKQYARAQFFERQGKFSEAAAMFKELTVSFPTSPLMEHSWFAIALDERRTESFSDAKLTLEQFLEKFDDSILRDKVLFTLGDLLETELNDPSGAMTVYTRILAEYPNSIYSNTARERILALRKGQS
jgi:tetratricopeptide (TPR) repeat protein